MWRGTFIAFIAAYLATPMSSAPIVPGVEPPNPLLGNTSVIETAPSPPSGFSLFGNPYEGGGLEFSATPPPSSGVLSSPGELRLDQGSAMGFSLQLDTNLSPG
jgi:hypothetical protein